MKSAQSLSRSTWVLLLLMIIVSIGLVFLPYDKPRPIESDIETPASIDFSDAAVTRPLSALSDTRSRPLFSSTRRPGPIATDPIEDTPIAETTHTSEIALIGTLLKRSEERALLGSSEVPSGEWINIGDNFEGWILEEVKYDHVVLQADDVTETLTLFPATEVADPTVKDVD